MAGLNSVRGAGRVASWSVICAMLMLGAAPVVAQQPGGNGVGTAFELSFWQSVGDSNDRAQLEAYLAQYPLGTFSGLAKAKIAALPAPAAAAPAPSAPAPAPSAPRPMPVATVAAMPAPAPAPAPVAIPAAAPAMMTPAVLTTAGAAAPAAGAAAPAAAMAAPSLLEQMATLGKQDGPSAPALFTESGTLPARPVMIDVAMAPIPDHFCSAEQRNQFHDAAYKAAVARADQNNDATIAHLRNVQALHAQAIAAKQVAGANALAREALEYKPAADQAYQARTAIAELFGRIMAVPLTGC